MNIQRKLGEAWGPLAQPVFRSLWLASVASNIGTWMHSVGAAWLMTSLTQSPLLIALLTTMGSLPIFLVGLPAGALADVLDRRRIVLLTQVGMLAVAAVLGVLTFIGLMSPPKRLSRHGSRRVRLACICWSSKAPLPPALPAGARSPGGWATCRRCSTRPLPLPSG